MPPETKFDIADIEARAAKERPLIDAIMLSVYADANIKDMTPAAAELTTARMDLAIKRLFEMPAFTSNRDAKKTVFLNIDLISMRLRKIDEITSVDADLPDPIVQILPDPVCKLYRQSIEIEDGLRKATGITVPSSDLERYALLSYEAHSDRSDDFEIDRPSRGMFKERADWFKHLLKSEFRSTSPDLGNIAFKILTDVDQWMGNLHKSAALDMSWRRKCLKQLTKLSDLYNEVLPSLKIDSNSDIQPDPKSSNMRP